jgi:hypothetical protein
MVIPDLGLSAIFGCRLFFTMITPDPRLEQKYYLIIFGIILKSSFVLKEKCGQAAKAILKMVNKIKP